MKFYTSFIISVCMFSVIDAAEPSTSSIPVTKKVSVLNESSETSTAFILQKSAWGNRNAIAELIDNVKDLTEHILRLVKSQVRAMQSAMDQFVTYVISETINYERDVENIDNMTQEIFKENQLDPVGNICVLSVMVKFQIQLASSAVAGYQCLRPAVQAVIELQKLTNKYTKEMTSEIAASTRKFEECSNTGCKQEYIKEVDIASTKYSEKFQSLEGNILKSLAKARELYLSCRREAISAVTYGQDDSFNYIRSCPEWRSTVFSDKFNCFNSRFNK
ncbi:uncharacterized protein LOC119659678 [Hermetia illucens]|uniref:uncharacterized protein LOC119659678 n=1 Tax=Hermetia illucens TaxID=343691 RepID=UPI0018CC11E7|nr:uncharacterized protein LOC119659678 [Hermetia illucens]